MRMNIIHHFGESCAIWFLFLTELHSALYFHTLDFCTKRQTTALTAINTAFSQYGTPLVDKNRCNQNIYSRKRKTGEKNA